MMILSAALVGSIIWLPYFGDFFILILVLANTSVDCLSAP
jgi:hypothetical protein